MLSSNYFSKLLPIFFTAFSVVSTAQTQSIDLPVIPNTVSPTANTFSISSEHYNQGVASNCPKITDTDNPYVMHSQAEVDAFSKQYATCTSVPYLWISGRDIKNLKPLKHINEVGYGQRYYMTYSIVIGSVEDANGHIYNNESLTKLSGLNNIEKIKGGIRINGNPSLVKINAFNKLKHIQQNISLDNNLKLKSVKIFSQLIGISTDLIIENNPKTTNFKNSFSNLLFLRNLRLANTPFINPPKFSTLRSIIGALDLINTQLSNLTLLKLNSLIHIDGMIDIENNLSLTSLSGLNHIKYLGNFNTASDYDLVIGRNPELSDCSQLSTIYTPEKQSRYYFSPITGDLPKTCKTSFEGKSDYYKSAFIQ